MKEIRKCSMECEHALGPSCRDNYLICGFSHYRTYAILDDPCRLYFSPELKKEPTPSHQFDVVVENCIENIRKVLATKAEEYTIGNDRYHNFNVAARCGPNEESREKALEGMMRKHLVSIYDLINHPETRSIERIDEKIGDMINYLILLKGMMLEKLDVSE